MATYRYMNIERPTLPTVSDEELWRLSLEGDREAFGGIVERYQVLICSLAFSACGSLASSEDLAQETFLTAWRHLKELREPKKLRQWLCGIVRNLSANAVRRDLRRGGQPEALDVVAEEASAEKCPAAEAVTREEETLLWRALAGMPENYREPMVLFYREQQSVAEVASDLGLSEDAVKQRLSRGRALLRNEMTALVESTLKRTRPGSAFTLGVLAALPIASASAATSVLAAAAQAGGEAVGKGIVAKLGLGVLIGPAIGLICSYLGTMAAASTARSESERKVILRFSRWIIGFCFVMSIGLAAVLSQAGKLYIASAASLVLGVTAWTAVLVGGILLMCQRMDKEVRRIRIETATTDEAYAKVLAAQGRRALALPKYFESKTRFLGLPLFAIAWGGTNSDQYRARKLYAWVAIGDIAISPFVAIGGIAVAPIAIGAITIGVLSLSVFWGVAVGVLSVGSLAFGWWALACAAAAVKCAVGFAAVARDYAFGIVASGASVGAAAKEWVLHQWWPDFMAVMLHQIHWWILLCIVVALAIRAWRGPSDQDSLNRGED